MPRAQVLVTVPVLSLLGVTEEPAMLDGYGPIPPSMARRLLAEGADSFYRVLTDPRDGAPLEIGRTSYRPTKALRQWLRLRDGKCPFPGCNNPSLDNEADHVLAWADGGTTGITNLGQPCRKHHRLKHATAWTPVGAAKDHPPGWISRPAGHTQANTRTGNHPTGRPSSCPQRKTARPNPDQLILNCLKPTCGVLGRMLNCRVLGRIPNRGILTGIPTGTCPRTPDPTPDKNSRTTPSPPGTTPQPPNSPRDVAWALEGVRPL